MKTILIFIIAAGASLFIYNFAPERSAVYIKCPFLDITGLYCPGCGSMRCCYNILHGDIVHALDLNVFTVLALPFLVVAYVRLAVREFSSKKKNLVVKPFYFWGVVIFILAFWVLRNIPHYPFTILAP